ncbi:MAG: polyprenyl synthetase family protein [Candidatus Omnitrophota bacterium]
MFDKIKKKIDRELRIFSAGLGETYALNSISPLLTKNIKNFITREGKRARPVLFVAGYLGFAKKEAAGLYRSALSIELLHDFMLIHDDIIDKSDTRRGKPSFHKMLNNYLRGYKNLKFNGQDLAIVAGDVMYAMAIDTFLSIKENPCRKERALKKFIEAAMYTGSGEFIELLAGIKNIEAVSMEDIYKIYGFKTAYYTFACPLSIGAILAGAPQEEIDIISEYGAYLGNAFQIKDDILGIFEEERETGKSALADLQEAKKTILIWYAWRNSSKKGRAAIKRILSKKSIGRPDLLTMRRIISISGSRDFAEKEISRFLQKSLALISRSKMRPQYKNSLADYSRKILA